MKAMVDNGATRVYVKELAENDNAKNQIYLGGDFSSLNIFPFDDLSEDDSVRAGSKRSRVKASIEFYWLYSEGLYKAPGANLILYPRYPEVRLSGLLQGSARRPSSVINSRKRDRLLILGITRDARILGHAVSPDSRIAFEYRQLAVGDKVGVFVELSTDDYLQRSTRKEMLTALRRVHEMGWIPSQRRKSMSQVVAYKAQNGGGYTLESVLGITPNGFSAPDYLGWEIKQFSVADFQRFRAKSPITLMTPEPTGGEYRDRGIDWFVRTYGYPDQNGKADRLNFGGTYRANAPLNRLTRLSLSVTGFDKHYRRLTDLDGGIVLLNSRGEVAAIWHHRSLIGHWSRKHAQAAYVPSLSRTPPPEYRYGNLVNLGERTDFLRFLTAMIDGAVYYDPGVKLEHASSASPSTKQRSQFRIRKDDLHTLYESFQVVNLLDV